METAMDAAMDAAMQEKKTVQTEVLQDSKQWKTLSLEELRGALSRVEAERASAAEGTEVFAALEEGACLLRDLERKKLAEMQKELARLSGLNLQELKDLARRIRERVTRMGKVPKGLDKADEVLKELCKFLDRLF